jgi:hypothetical protein
LGSRGRMRSTDVVRPIAQQSATSAPARSPQGTNSPKAVCIIPPPRTINTCFFTFISTPKIL